MNLSKRFIAALTLLMVSSLSSAGAYVNEAQCFGGSVPSSTTGASATTSVYGSGGVYTVTAWRQACQSDSSSSALMLKFQAVSGSPTIGSITVTQSGLSYTYQRLVKDPTATSLINYMQLGTFSQVNTILEQFGGARFDVNGALTIGFGNTSAGTTSLTLAASTSAQSSASVDVFYGNMTDMWWNTSENGTGMSIIHHGSNQLFAVWYTYSDSGDPLWIVMSGGSWTDSKTFTGALYKTRGTSFSQPWNQSALQVGSSVGNGTLAFTASDSVTFSYSVNGVTGSRVYTRQSF